MSVTIDDFPFSQVCKMLAIIRQNKKQAERPFAIFLRQFQPRTDSGLFELLRLFCPNKDSERGNYHLKEKLLAKAYIDSVPGTRKTQDECKGRDIGDFIGEVLEGRPSVPETPATVTMINSFLRTLQDARGGRNVAGLAAIQGQKDKTAVIREHIDSFTVEEHQWLCRIITKDLKLGVQSETLLGWWHPQAKADIETQSLLSVCQRMMNADGATSAGQITLMSAFSPMLCSPPRDLETLLRHLRTGHWFYEDKLDGERLLVHKRGDEIRLFSRFRIEFFIIGSLIVLHRKRNDFTRLGPGHAAIINDLRQALGQHEFVEREWFLKYSHIILRVLQLYR